MNINAASAKVRQLCTLQVAPTQLLPAILHALHRVVSSDLNVFAWAGADGNPDAFFAEFPTPPALMEHYQAEFLGRPGAEVGPSFQYVLRNPGFQDSGMDYGNVFRESGLYQAIFRPLGLDNALRISVGDAQGFVGVLTLDRAYSSRDFTPQERRRLIELMPHLAHALRRPAAPNGHWIPSSEEGLLILGHKNQIQVASSGAEHLLQLACAHQSREALMEKIVCLSSALQVTLAGRYCRPAIYALTNPWGRFEFRAHPLFEGGAERFHTGISICRWQPLRLGVALGAQALGLSARQVQLCVLAAEGKTYAEMAQTMCIATSTAIGYMRVIYDKLAVADRAALCQRLVGGSLQIDDAFQKSPQG